MNETFPWQSHLISRFKYYERPQLIRMNGGRRALCTPSASRPSIRQRSPVCPPSSAPHYLTYVTDLATMPSELRLQLLLPNCLKCTPDTLPIRKKRASQMCRVGDVLGEANTDRQVLRQCAAQSMCLAVSNFRNPLHAPDA